MNTTDLISLEPDPSGTKLAELSPPDAIPIAPTPADPKPTAVDLTHGLGKVLRAMRRSRNLTQRRVGELVKVSTSAICDIEHGRNNLSVDMLWRVCQALSLRPHVSLRGKDSAKPLLATELTPVESDPVASASTELRPPALISTEPPTAWNLVADAWPPYDEHERVLVHTDGSDFAGEQFFDVKVSDFYRQDEGCLDTGTEVTRAATHWMPRPFLRLSPVQLSSSGANPVMTASNTLLIPGVVTVHADALTAELEPA